MVEVSAEVVGVMIVLEVGFDGREVWLEEGRRRRGGGERGVRRKERAKRK